MDLEQLEELQLLVSFKEENEDSAHRAFEKIYKKYSRYLFSVVQSKLEDMNILDDTLLKSSVNNTFIKFYENPLKFEVPENAINDNCFKGWLSRVAKREVLNLLRENQSKERIGIETTMDIHCFQDDDFSDVEECLSMKILKGALQGIKERDRGILMMLFMYFEEGKKTPSDVLDVICNTFGTTRDNIRRIKSRSLEKIKQYIVEVEQQKLKTNGR